MKFRQLFLSVLAAVLAAAPPAHAAPRPKLVLAVVVDQFRYDYLTRFRSDYNAGLARLLQQGAVFTNAHYEHFPTVTAIGHSTMLSGATPSLSGIVGNEWYDRELGKQVTSVSDTSVPLLGAQGRAASSPRKLLVSTIGDELKMANGGASKVIGISIKDRSAILPVGRMADSAYWFDNGSGNFVSSGYYFTDLPQWVKEFNRNRHADRYVGAEWTSVVPNLARSFLKMAAEPGPTYFNSLERSPYGNELIFEFARHAIQSEELGKDDQTDVLAVSFSSNDYIGHEVGPDAPQVRDISIRTDRLLGQLFDFLDQKIGMDRVMVVLSADHGVAPLPELMQQRKMPGGRITEESVLEKVRTELSARFGAGNWIVGKSGPAPYLNHDLVREKQLDLAEVQRVAAQTVRNIPHIFRVYTHEQLAAGRLLSDLVDRRVQNGFHAARGADLFIVSEPYWLFQKSGTSHGTPFNYDSHVPVIFMGPGVKSGKYHRRAAVNDIAPTLATILEVETPSGSVGRVLDEILIH